jgi:hypothetical protein
MKSSSASQLVNFENTICEKCGRPLGFFPEITNMANIEAGHTGRLFSRLGGPLCR